MRDEGSVAASPGTMLGRHLGRLNLAGHRRRVDARSLGFRGARDVFSDDCSPVCHCKGVCRSDDCNLFIGASPHN